MNGFGEAREKGNGVERNVNVNRIEKKAQIVPVHSGLSETQDIGVIKN